jgi:hypothetical protein
MTLSIQAASSFANLHKSDQSQGMHRPREYQAMMGAIASGDLDAAQKAYDSLAQSRVGGGRDADARDGLMAKLGEALKTGDLEGVQQAAQAIQAKRDAHGRTDGRPQGADSGNTSRAQNPPPGLGALLNVTA